MNTRNMALSVCLAWGVFSMGLASTAWGESPSLAWKAQLGTSTADYARGVAVDSAGNAYITGVTNGSLGGTNQGQSDAFLGKYSPTGSLSWKIQFGTPNLDYPSGVAADPAGNAFITGYTYDVVADRNDTFLAKHSPSGDLVWKTQLGTAGLECARDLALDRAGNAYITGYTTGSLSGTNQGGRDAFLVKYSPTGDLAWKTQLGSPDYDETRGVAVDSAGNVYIMGYTSGSLGGTSQGDNDVFLAKYSSTGSLTWKTQLGTSSYDEAGGVAVDSAGNAYITGSTYGSLGGTNQGSCDAFLAKYSAAGSLVWTAQLGTSAKDYAYGVGVDGADSAYITGRTWDNLGGPNLGGADVFLAKYSSMGSLVWTAQFGTPSDDIPDGLAMDSVGSVYIAGSTNGSLDGTNQGGYDAFLVKYDVPEPATLALLAVGGLAVLRRRK